jgi:Plavaka transposase
MLGHPCSEDGANLPLNTPPPPRHTNRDADDWTPYRDRIEFETAQFLYCRTQMSASNINTLLDLWASTLLKYNEPPPFANYTDLYDTIDSTPLGDVAWQSFSLRYNSDEDPMTEGTLPDWMTSEYEVWFRDPRMIIKGMIDNPDYNHHTDVAPVRVFNSNGIRVYQNFMSGDWAWEEAVSSVLFFVLTSLILQEQDKISQDPTTHGAMLVPVILGSDKTTVSVATGQNEYYPLYVSIGSVHNNIRRAHRGALALIAFLAIPKSESF